MMTIKTEVLNATAKQTIANAVRRIEEIHSDAAIRAGLIASRAGGSKEPSFEAWLSPLEFDACVSDPKWRRRHDELAAQGIGALVFDGGEGPTGRRDRCIKFWVLPDPTPPRVRQ